MALTKEQRRQKKAQKQLNKKLRLEADLMRQMRRFLTTQNVTVSEAFKQSGIVLDASISRDELQEILQFHYQKTARVFVPEIIDDINKEMEKEGVRTIDKDNPELWLALLLFIRREVSESVDAITKTSNADISDAINIADGDTTIFSGHLKDRVLPRARTISITETQKAAEGGKQTAAKELVKTANVILPLAAITQAVKIWLTRLDMKVRPVHASAEGQEVPLADPFVVGGEMLMYPGDSSFGASLWNIINCRCTSIQEFRIIY